MKLSEEIKHCLDNDGCDKCRHGEPETKLTCRGLLQAAYEEIKRNEEREKYMRIDRLTIRVNGYAHGAKGVTKEKLTGEYCRGHFEATACVEKLAEYEDLEEQGRLLKLPVCVGNTVWSIEKEERKIYRCTVKSIEISDFCSFALIEKDFIYRERVGYIRVPLGNFGKTVFFTKSEAENALKKMNEMEGENE